MHMAGSVDLLLCTQEGRRLDRVLFVDVRTYYRVEFFVGKEDSVFEAGGNLAECFCISCE